ncbi:sigma-70 family RNA polymerase sigma factor [Undibacterium pigrum]|uniref:RNA polymerase sigma-70 factor (ECF subfamily) n=1 Tax=Undibacterium pigrum TaxID=401470 RepID=A0A318J5E0_9BURK|nr:sigma-70 family RNA polymerase sigma factor [Undibacterium pigrum]PXX41851.1 RNA polymerase sigma-70 factor (ECF subfamily) [Undibacterium pigrum]
MTSITDLHQQLENLRPGLYRFAQLQLRNECAAEDAVQETLLAVLEKPDSFAGNSSLRTYVTGILKFKIIDHLRSLKREKPLETRDDESEDDLIDSLFNANGHALSTPSSWGAPEATLQQKDFFRVLELCLENLPAKTARVFMMREWLELETEEICKELDLSTSNLWVVLYRARLRLRECLDLNWFGLKT